MAQIKSREELEAWLNDKPADWAQVIAARVALRALPYAFVKQTPDKWISAHALNLFRTITLLWVARNFLTLNTISSAIAAAVRNTTHANSYPVDAAPARHVATAVSAAASVSVSYAAWEVIAAGSYSSSTAYSAHAASTEVWTDIRRDCGWLVVEGEHVLASWHLTREKLWLGAIPLTSPSMRADATTRLLALDPTYQVWIDWYNRRIEGHEAAFDIPGDIDRVHDKAILARLADATDEDFWGKGATYVNTALQSWIDEARIDAQIDQITAKLRGGANAHYGAPKELAERATLLDELDRLLGKSPQARHGIGGNYPPEPIGAGEHPVALPDEMREPLEAISTELEKREPNALVIVEQVKLVHRVGSKLEKLAGLALDKYAEEFGGELGRGTAKLITRAPYLAAFIMLINQILDWLAPLIR